jgi:DNA adenine methylase
MNKISAFAWYGGKQVHLNWLLPFINSTSHHVYVEPFGGSAAVLLNKNTSPVEVYNDIYSDVVNFFRILRNHKDELISQLQLTPFSREEFADCCNQEGNFSPLEQARRFFVRAKQVRNGLATQATPGRWSYTKKDSRRGIGLNVSAWLSAIDGLEDVCGRLKEVQIENLDAFDIITRYDSENTLHYIDPPYVAASRPGGKAYKHEFNDEKHIELLNLLKTVKGKVILSGYENEIYSKELSDWKQHRNDFKTISTSKDDDKKLKQEIIWKNFA